MGGLIPGTAPAVGDLVGDVAPEEHEEVQQRHHRQQRPQQAAGKQAGQHRQGKERGIHPGQPLDFHRDDEEQQNPHVRIQHGKGKKHGEVHVAGTRNPGMSCDKAHHHASDHRQHHAGKIVEIKFCRAPLPLQGGADHVIKIQENRQPEGVPQGVIPRHEDERHQTPDLPVENGGPVEHQKADGSVVGEHRQQVHQHRTGHNDLHQIGYAEIGMAIGEPVHRGVKLFQG